MSPFPFSVRLLKLVLFVFAFTALPGSRDAQALAGRRDWQKHPAIAEVDTVEDVYAIGDIHGDYDRLISLLTAAKIVAGDPGPPQKVQWRAGKAVLVCTGDFIDKWNQSLRVVALLRHLQGEAVKAGGRFIITLGNHEAEFLADPTKKKVADFRKELEGEGLKVQDVVAGTDAKGIGAWLRSLPVAARVNDWFFVHAGNTANRTLAELRRDLQTGLDKDGFKSAVLQDERSLLQARMHPRPWWEPANATGRESKELLTKCVDSLGVKHLVIGHQPQAATFADKTTRPAGELFHHFDGLIFLIDTGMSRGIALSSGAVLHLRNGNKKLQAFRIDATGKSQQIWPVEKGEMRR